MTKTTLLVKQEDALTHLIVASMKLSILKNNWNQHLLSQRLEQI